MAARELAGVGILAALAVAALAVSRRAAAAVETPEGYAAIGGGELDYTTEASIADEPGYSSPDPVNMAPPSDTPELEASAAAFLAMIRQFEARGDYTLLYGGHHFADFSAHPNIRVPFRNPRTGRMDYSTAAGAYQINYPTYQDIAPQLGISDFSPASQDAIALYLLQKTGAYNALAAGDFAGAVQLASSRWASLPGSRSGQNQRTMQAAIDTYNGYLA